MHWLLDQARGVQIGGPLGTREPISHPLSISRVQHGILTSSVGSALLAWIWRGLASRSRQNTVLSNTCRGEQRGTRRGAQRESCRRRRSTPVCTCLASISHVHVPPCGNQRDGAAQPPSCRACKWYSPL